MINGLDVLHENNRSLVKAVVAQALLDIAAGHRARLFELPPLGNQIFSSLAYHAYLDQTNVDPPSKFAPWFARQHKRASTKVEYGLDAEESLSCAELCSLCACADVYLPTNPTEAIALIRRRVECGEM